MAALEDLTQKIVLQAVADKPILTGLDATMERLSKIDAYLGAINQKITGISTNQAFKRSAAEFTSQIKTTGQQSTENLAKVFGFSEKDVTMFGAKIEAAARASIRKIEQAMAGMAKTTPTGRTSGAYRRIEQQLQREQDKLFFTSGGASTLKSPVAAGKFFEMYAREAAAQMGMRGNALKRLLAGGTTPSMGQVAAGATAARIVGQINLEIPASQISARVIGDIARGVVRDPGSGKFVSTGAPAARPQKTKSSGTAYNPPTSASELERTITQSEESIRTTIMETESLGVTMARTYDDLGKEVRTRLKVKATSPIMQDLRARQATFAAQLRSNIAKAAPGDTLGLADLKIEAASHLERMISPDLEKMLQAKGITAPQLRISTQAQVLRAQAHALQSQAASSANLSVGRVQALMSTPLNMMSFIQQTLGPQPMAAHAQRQAYYQNLFGLPPGPPIIPPPKIPGAGAGGAGRGFGTGRRNWASGFQPGQYAANVATVAGWAGAVYPVMQARDAMEGLLQKTIEVQEQTARLANVFRGTGGTAQELAGDILKLSAAAGTDTEATLATSTSWAKLGLSRSQVNFATRQTAILSNTGDFSQEKAQEGLRGILSNYKLDVRDLRGIVAMITMENARTGTPQADILAGIAKASPMAAAGGMSLSELSAMIAVGSQRTSDTGLRTGGSLFAMFSQMNKPEVQQRLRAEFGIVPQGNLHDYLQEFYRVYEGSSRGQRARLEGITAGGVRGGRLEAYMQGYPEAQALASQSLTNPAAGDEAQARLMGTLKFAWQGLKSQTVSTVQQIVGESAGYGGGMSIADAIAQLMTGASNIMNTGIGKNVRFYAGMPFVPIGRAAKWMNENLFTSAMSQQEADSRVDATRRPDILHMQSLEDVESAEGYDAKRQSVLNYLRERKDLIEGITRVTQQLASIGEEGALLSQRHALTQQNQMITQGIIGLAGNTSASAEAARLEFYKQQEEVPP